MVLQYTGNSNHNVCDIWPVWRQISDSDLTRTALGHAANAIVAQDWLVDSLIDWGLTALSAQ